MGALSAGAEHALRLAGAEAAGRHPQIDNAHLLLALCGLEHALAGAPGPTPLAQRAARREAVLVSEALRACGLLPEALAGLLRNALEGTARPAPARAPVRGPACRETVYRAVLLAGGREASGLHLLASLGEDPDPFLARILRHAGTSLDRLKEAALRAAREARRTEPAGVERGADRLQAALSLLQPLLARLRAEARAEHGIELGFEPAAAAFIARAGVGPAQAERELERALGRWVEAPMLALAHDGKLRRHPRWTVAYDEGGVYVVPGESA